MFLLRAALAGLKLLGLGICICVDTVSAVLFFLLIVLWALARVAGFFLFLGGLTAGAIWKLIAPILKINNFHLLKTQVVQISSEPGEQPEDGWRVGRAVNNGVVVNAIAEREDFFSAKGQAREAGLHFAGVRFAPYGLTSKFFYTFFVVERG